MDLGAEGFGSESDQGLDGHQVDADQDLGELGAEGVLGFGVYASLAAEQADRLWCHVGFDEDRSGQVPLGRKAEDSLHRDPEDLGDSRLAQTVRCVDTALPVGPLGPDIGGIEALSGLGSDRHKAPRASTHGPAPSLARLTDTGTDARLS